MSEILKKLSALTPASEKTRLDVSALIQVKRGLSYAKASPFSILWTGLALSVAVLAVFSLFYKSNRKPGSIESTSFFGSKSPESRLEEFNKKGLESFRKKNFDAATEQFSRGLREFPREIGLYVNLAMVYKKQGFTALALANLETAQRLEPSNPIPHNNLGVLLSELGRFPEAEKSLELAVKNADEKYFDPFINYGRLKEHLGQFGEAASVYRVYAEKIGADSQIRKLFLERMRKLQALAVQRKEDVYDSSL